MMEWIVKIAKIAKLTYLVRDKTINLFKKYFYGNLIQIFFLKMEKK